MAIATAISGIFLFLFTTSGNPNTQLAFSSLEALFQNIMYGVLYAYTPEVFPAPNRGTGSGAFSSFLWAIMGGRSRGENHKNFAPDVLNKGNMKGSRVLC